MRKLFILAVFAASVSGVVEADNLYVDKTYTTIVAPTNIGVSAIGATTTTVAAVSNAVDGVAMFTFPGSGALVLGINCGDGGTGVITPSVLSCATTAGVYTAESQFTSRPYTNGNQFVVVPFVPNQTKGYLRVAFTASNVTNGFVSAMTVNTTK